VEQAIEIAGALLVLAGYAGYLTGRWSPRSLPYLGLNLVGGVTLAVIAALGANWGFLLLQAVWAVAAAWGLGRRFAERKAAA
jgi:hypothetical protein